MRISSTGFNVKLFSKTHKASVSLSRQPAKVPFIASQSEKSLLRTSIQQRRCLMFGPVATADRQKQVDRFEAKLIQSNYIKFIQLFSLISFTANALICFRKIKAVCKQLNRQANEKNWAFILINRFCPASLIGSGQAPLLFDNSAIPSRSRCCLQRLGELASVSHEGNRSEIF